MTPFEMKLVYYISAFEITFVEKIISCVLTV